MTLQTENRYVNVRRSDQPESTGGDELIVSQIAAAQSRIKATDVMTAIAGCGILLTTYILLFTLADHWLVSGGFSPWTRALLLIAVVIGVLIVAWRSLVRPMTKAVTALYAARMLDRQSSSGGALVSLVDLELSGSGGSDRVRRTIASRAKTHLRATNLDDALDRSQLMRMGMVLFGLILITCLYSVLSPKPISLLRPLTLWGQDVATRTRITGVSPGSATIPLGGQVEVTADISGIVPDTVRLLYTTADEGYVDAELQMQRIDDNDRFRTVITGDDIRGIRQALTYQIHAGDAQSDVYSISVDVPPTASVQEVRYQYPAYMQLPDSTSISPALDTWEGTRVTVIAEATVPVAEASLELCADPGFQSGVASHPADIDGRNLTAGFTLFSSDADRPFAFYRVVVQDERGTRDPSPTVYPVTVRPDLAPVVQLVNPVRDLEVPANATVPLLIRATDPDFLLRSVSLHYTIDQQPVEPGELIYDSVETGAQKTWTGTYDFELNTFNLSPGSVVEYTIRATDNRTPRPSTSSTPPLKLTILAPASPEELQESLESTREFQERRLEQIQQEQQSQESGESPPSDSADSTTASEDDGTDADEAGSADADGTANGDSAGESDTAGQGAPTDDGSPSGTPSAGEPGATSPGPAGNDASPEGDSSTAGGSGADSGENTTNESAPMSDEEALQRIMERYRQEQSQGESQESGDNQSGDNQSGNDSQSGGNDSTGREPTETQSEGSKAGESPSEGSPSEGSQSGGSQSEGSPSEGSQSEGSPSEGSQSEGSPSEGSQSEGSQSDGSQSEGSQSGGSQSEGSQSGGSQSGGSQSGGSQSGGSQSGGSEAGGSEAGGSEAGGSEAGGSEAGGSESGGSESGGSEAGGSEAGGSEAGGSEAGGSESGGSEAGGSEAGGSEAGGSEAGGSEAGGSEAGGSEAGGSEAGGSEAGGSEAGGSEAGGSEAGGSEAGGSEAGGSEAGGSEAGGSEAGGSEAGGSESGGSEAGGSEAGGSESGGSETGGSESGGSEAGGGKSGGSPSAGNKPGGQGSPGGRAMPGGSGTGSSSDSEPDVDEPNLEDTAQAADLALQHLEQDLEQGTLDEELLDELGWTPERLKSFGERMREQLQQLDEGESDDLREVLQQKRLKEMLRELELSSERTAREGTTAADREQQDTTVRRREPPQRYRARDADFRRKVLDGARRRRQQK